MVIPIARSLVVILLLAVDWASDPHHGLSAFSQPMSSQQVVPVWTAHRHEIRVRVNSLPGAAPGFDGADLFLQPSILQVVLRESTPAIHFNCDSLYLFMSLQR
jgi:hypothetical protein